MQSVRASWFATILILTMSLGFSNLQAFKTPGLDLSSPHELRTGYRSWLDMRKSGIDSVRTAGGWGVVFRLSTSVQQVHFTKEADFSFLTFDSAASFNSTEFDTVADFQHTRFKAPASFRNSTFHSANFWNARFDSLADFVGAVLHGKILMNWVTFGNRLDLRRAEIYGNLTLTNDTLPDYLDLRWVKIVDGTLDLTGCHLPRSGTKCKIALQGADISKIKLNMGLFSLWFPDTLYVCNLFETNMDAVTLSQPSIDEKIGIYESLLSRFKELGLEKSFEKLDIEYRSVRSKAEGFFAYYVGDTFQKYWWTYGYDPELVFMWSVSLWLFFSLLASTRFNVLSKEVFQVSVLKHDAQIVEPQGGRRLSPLFGAIALVSVLFFGVKFDVEKLQPSAVNRHPWLTGFVILVYISGIICLGYVANIVFTK